MTIKIVLQVGDHVIITMRHGQDSPKAGQAMSGYSPFQGVIKRIVPNTVEGYQVEAPQNGLAWYREEELTYLSLYKSKDT
jgi:hypothetical protein